MTATQFERLTLLYHMLKMEYNIGDECLEILQSIIDEAEIEKVAQKKKADGRDIQKLSFL